jgi:hypothetical protein
MKIQSRRDVMRKVLGGDEDTAAGKSSARYHNCKGKNNDRSFPKSKFTVNDILDTMEWFITYTASLMKPTRFLQIVS